MLDWKEIKFCHFLLKEQLILCSRATWEGSPLVDQETDLYPGLVRVSRAFLQNFFLTTSLILGTAFCYKDTINCPEKAMKISHINPNQSVPSIYIMIELCCFSLDQWVIKIHMLWGNISIFLTVREASRPMQESKTLQSFLNSGQERAWFG